MERTFADRLVKYEEGKEGQRLFRGVLLALILVLVLAWRVFFQCGDFSIDYLDWAEVWAPRLQGWKVALEANTLPFHMAIESALRSASDRFLTVGDMVFTPQLILLKWVTVQQYALINQLLLALVGTFYLVKLRQKYRISILTFVLIFVLFHFNGFIVAHTSVGHQSWGGYYLFPAFVYYVIALIEGDLSWRAAGKVALTLLVMLLQGSLHHLVWCLLALGMFLIFQFRHAVGYLKAILFSFLLGMLRLLPPFYFAFREIASEPDLLGGYPSILNLAQAFGFNGKPANALPRQIFDSPLGYWEFDLYLGKIGALIVLIALIAEVVQVVLDKRIPLLLLVSSGLAILSLDHVFFKVFFYQPVFIATERVTSRFMGLGLVILLLLSANRLQRLLDAVKVTGRLLLGILALLAVIVYDLGEHMLDWSVGKAASTFPYTRRVLEGMQISNHADPEYYTVLIVAATLSVLAGVLLFLLQWAESRRAKGLRSESGRAPAQPR